MSMKILVVSNMYPNKEFPSYGIFVKNFCSQLELIGVSYDLSVLTKSDKNIKKLLKYFYFYFCTILKCLIFNYDYIYIHYPSYSALPVLWVNKVKKMRIITNVHGSDVLPLTSQNKKQEKYTRQSVISSIKVVVPSEYFKEIVAKKYDIEKNRIIIYPSGGIDKKIFYSYPLEKKRVIKRNLGFSEDKLLVGFISRLYEVKGWRTFLDAAEILSKSDPAIEFVMVGSGEDEEKVNKVITEKKLYRLVHRFPGQPQEKLADFYNILDAFVFPTAAAESLGLVAIEAMACGVPVFASDYAAPKYYIKNGVNGYKFDVGNSEQLAQLLKDYLHSSRKNKDYIIYGSIKSSESFSVSKISKIVETIFVK